ncbi:hypothetical protein GCM10010376_83960 [Streptomyces violaceusniger]
MPVAGGGTRRAADHDQAVRLGATGVPFTVLGERLGIPGAVSTAQYTTALDQAGSRSMDDQAPGTPAPLRFLDGEAEGLCDPATGVCAVPGAPAPSTAPSDNTAPSGGETADTPIGG